MFWDIQKLHKIHCKTLCTSPWGMSGALQSYFDSCTNGDLLEVLVELFILHMVERFDPQPPGWRRKR